MEKTSHPDYAEENNAVWHSLTFCNANPFRATALYSAGFYDKVSQTANDPRFTLDDFDFSTDQLQQYSHSISNMLKRCKLNNGVCGPQHFEVVRTKYGICYQLQIPIKPLMQLELILDPEENEYVLPNDGYIGFLILLNHSSIDRGDFFIGTGFHNIVRLSVVVPINGLSCGHTSGSQLRVDSITQTVKSALYQSLLPRVLTNSPVDSDREVLSRLIQQRAFLRAMNRSAFDEVVHLASQLTSIRVAVGFIDDFMRQATHALKVETAIVPQQGGCGADLQNTASKLLVDLLEAQELWFDAASTTAAGLVIDNTVLTNTSAGADVELSLVECFFAAQNIGTRLKSHLRELIRNLLEINPPRGLNSERQGAEISLASMSSTMSHSNREVFQPISASELLATGNSTICRRVQEIYRVRTAMLIERASSVVALIDRLNSRLHSLTAENRETRAHFALSQSSRHNLPFVATRFVTVSISIKEEEHSQLCFTHDPNPMNYIDNLIGILTGTLGLWISMMLVIEIHWRNFRVPRDRMLRLRSLQVEDGNSREASKRVSDRNPEDDTNVNHDGAYEHCSLVPSNSMPQKLIPLNEEGPPEMWLTLPQSVMEMTTHSMRQPKNVLYRQPTTQSTVKISRNQVSLLDPSASSSTQTVIIDSLQNRF
nr:amiloride sensitive cation channel 4 A [Hymenolepis microstoma]